MDGTLVLNKTAVRNVGDFYATLRRKVGNACGLWIVILYRVGQALVDVCYGARHVHIHKWPMLDPIFVFPLSIHYDIHLIRVPSQITSHAKPKILLSSIQ